MVMEELTPNELTSDNHESEVATAIEKLAYERLCYWRATWLKLACKFERNRLQSRQERIELRAAICNLKIALLMRSIDNRVKNTINPISDESLIKFKFEVMKLKFGI